APPSLCLPHVQSVALATSPATRTMRARNRILRSRSTARCCMPELVRKLALTLACFGAACAQPPSAPTARTSPIFEFHSDPWVNLHQRLVAEATVNKYWHRAVETCACAKTADGAVLPAWSAAVSGYKSMLDQRSTVSDTDLMRTNLAFGLAGTS